MDSKEPTIKFDHHSQKQADNPYPLYAEMRSKCPLAHADAYGGFHVAATYDLVRRIYSDYSVFSSTGGAAIPRQGFELLPNEIDPPQQTKFRRILNPLFTAEKAEKRRQEIQDLVDTLIDSFIETGRAELLGDLLLPTMSGVVLPMFGIPSSQLPVLATLVDFMVRRRGENPELAVKKGEELYGHLFAHVERRRAAPPKDDVLDALIGARIDGEALTTDQVVRTVVTILFGGLDTTGSTTSEALLHLLSHPEDRARLLSGEAKWETAIEEFVRFASPLQGEPRTTTREVELAGITLPQGERVFALLASANHDPEKFPEADRCIIDRAPNEHLGFGNGAHICLGRHLARMEIKTLLETMFHRLKDLAVAEDFVPVYSSGEVRGLRALAVTFTPGKRKRTAA